MDSTIRNVLTMHWMSAWAFSIPELIASLDASTSSANSVSTGPAVRSSSNRLAFSAHDDRTTVGTLSLRIIKISKKLFLYNLSIYVMLVAVFTNSDILNPVI